MTDFITDRAEEMIKNHDQSKPLYLHLAHLAGHASESDDSLEVRNVTNVNLEFGYIRDDKRRRFAGINKYI